MDRVVTVPARSASTASQPPTSHLRDLRSTLAWLRERGDLIESEREINPDLEVTGLQKLMDGGCPALFANVKGKPNHRVLTNLFGSIEVVNKIFCWESDKDRTIKLARALNKPLPSSEILYAAEPSL